MIIWIKNNNKYHFPDIRIQSPNCLDIVWIILPNLTCILACLYIPGSYQSSDIYLTIHQYLQDAIDNLLLIYPEYNLVICGDFNSYYINNYLSDLLVSNNLLNIVTTPTRHSNILDLILVSDKLKNEYNPVLKGPPIGNSDHSTLLLYPKNCVSTKLHFKKIYDLRRQNIEAFKSELEIINWRRVYHEDGISSKTLTFHDIIQNVFLKTIPYEYVQMSNNDKIWVTPTLKTLFNKRWNAYRNKNWPLYQHYKNKVKERIQVDKSNWAKKSSQSSRSMWAHVKSVTGKVKNNLDQLLDDFESDLDATTTINEFFESVFLKEDPQHLSTIRSNIVDDNWHTLIDTEWTMSKLLILDTTKSYSTGDIPPYLYKECAHILSSPITHLINESVIQRQVPDLWKVSDIIPIPKKHPPTVSDLRPVSILKLPAKLLEKAIIETNKHILLEKVDSSQYAYRPNSSTTCAHIHIQKTVTELLDTKDYNLVVLVSFDMSKAFDTVSHSLLLNKLNHLPNGLRRWLCNYLQGRKQHVKARNTQSDAISVSSGVPQGSCIGPILFTLFISDLTQVPTNLNIEVVKYADDVTFLIPFNNNVSNYEEEITRAIGFMEDYCRINKLKLNTDKTKILPISYSRNFVNQFKSSTTGYSIVLQHRFLGLVYSSDFTWDNHITNICGRASSRLYAIRVLKRSGMGKENLVQIYNALIRQLLEYACPAFVVLPHHLCSKIRSVQHRAHFIICGNNNCNCNNFTSLITRRNNLSYDLFLKSLNISHPLNKFKPASLPSGRLRVPFSRTTRKLNSFLLTSILKFNQLFHT